MESRIDLSGRTCVVTGGSTGIGFETARALARRGAEVAIVSRNPARGAAAVAAIAEEGGRAPELHLADLSARASVERLARDLLERYPAIHVLVNNAGVFRSRYGESEDGVELTFATNHLGPFLLTSLLRKRLEASAPARVVVVTSDLHRRATLDPSDPAARRDRFSGMAAYNRSKLANLLFTHELARRLDGTGVSVNAVHPGGVATRIAQDDGGWLGLVFRLARPFLLKPEQGADTVIWLASSPEVEGVTGSYFVRRTETEASDAARSDALARALWDSSEKLSPTRAE